ncbi:PTS system cellobiose-specific IIB component [Streptohalobacillus salinus]|uniref:PTS system cellobiose-specific IIB component n=1 Tax=Streptohalobacillus salinus TaxID=621096 RepID=A0A2V3WH43_9BACI|nr:PTS sugar transporter subunit IIB [Streptohalobacillus salinus]PXW92724.1 PTS system cellobiose-specific IIB component [Streptohalobacillus salinus]
MKHIVLVCAVGMSSSILVNRMIKAATKTKTDVLVHGSGMGDLSQFIDEADVLLIGPQIRYMEDKLKKQYSHLPIEVIESKDYSMMNGEHVLEIALSLLKENDTTENGET